MSEFLEGHKFSFSLRPAKIINLQSIKPPTHPRSTNHDLFGCSWSQLRWSSSILLTAKAEAVQSRGPIFPSFGDFFPGLICLYHLSFLAHDCSVLSLQGCQQALWIIHMYFACERRLVWSQAGSCNHYSCKDQKLLACFVYFLNVRISGVCKHRDRKGETNGPSWH